MPLPLYFVPDAGSPPPGGHLAACGWYAKADGSLAIPADVSAADALVFDDRDSLPAHWEDLLVEAARIGAAQLILDFERPYTPIAAQLVAALAARFPTAAPLAFCAGSAATPICCYSPLRETFSDFLSRLCGWAELRPVDERISYPISPAAAPACSDAFFSPALQCFCTAQTLDDRLCLHLSDTAESFQTRLRLLSPHADAAIVLQSEWTAYHMDH